LDPQNVWNGLTPMANFDRLEISVNFPRTRFTLRNTESCLGFGRLPEKWPSYQFSHILVDRDTKRLVVPVVSPPQLMRCILHTVVDSNKTTTNGITPREQHKGAGAVLGQNIWGFPLLPSEVDPLKYS